MFTYYLDNIKKLILIYSFNKIKILLIYFYIIIPQFFFFFFHFFLFFFIFLIKNIVV